MCAVTVANMVASGSRLGAYEVTSALGAGGMGEVYRARDTRLGRDVAVKVLPAAFAHDEERRARFEQEARSVAALNHPNILALHDIGTHDGLAYMVTELVDGEPLREARLSPRKALDVAAQIAEGLAAAHAAGITHRDLKPDNVMLTWDGRVKILDFGLAKAAEAGDQGATRLQTDAGAVLGTASYMAPEQIRGGRVDPRTDIFAFGTLLYELLAGRRPFEGPTPAEIMTAILRVDPPDLPAEVPAAARHVVARCLEKNPDERFQSARDLAFALRHLAGSSVGAPQAAAGRRAHRWRGAGLPVVGFAAGAVLAGTAALNLAASRQSAIDPVQATRIGADRLDEHSPQFSPDGESVAYIRARPGLSELLVKPLDALAPTILVRVERSISWPRWTPDGTRICYTSAGSFWCVSSAGGTPQRVIDEAYIPVLTPDGQDLLFVRARAEDNRPWLFRVPTAGGDARPIGDASLPLDSRGVSRVSPDGSTVIAFGDSFRVAIPLDGGRRRPLPVEDGVITRWIDWFPDGRHIAVVEEIVRPVGFRLVVLDTRSAARRLVARSAEPMIDVSVGPDGTRLAYASGSVDRDIAEFSADGSFLRTVAATSNSEGLPAWMPDGERFVYRTGGPGSGADSIWMGYANGSAPTPLLQLETTYTSPHRVSPDGGRIAFADASGVHVIPATGGRAIRIAPAMGVAVDVCWSPDGEWIWFENGPVRLRKVSSTGGTPIPVEAPAGELVDCSPDGRWLARTTRDGLTLIAPDGTGERLIARIGTFIGTSEAQHIFGQGGAVLYLLRPDRRSIDILDAESGSTRRTITFDLAPEDTITGFAVHPSGNRVLLTIGGGSHDLWMVEVFARPSAGWRRWLGHWRLPT